MTEKKKYTKSIRVTSYNVNRYAKLSTSSLFYYMQELAWEHAHSLGFGFEKLREDNLFWVLSRIWVKIEKRPNWKEELEITTWSRGSDNFYGYRDFEIIDKDNNSIVTATSSWLAISLDTKRIARLSKYAEFHKYEETQMSRESKKLKSPTSKEQLIFTPVLFNEIDINQHFNTGRYIERVIDSFDFDFHKKYQLSELEINFLKEGQPVDTLAVKKEKLSETHYLCSVVRESDHVELVTTELFWEKR